MKIGDFLSEIRNPETRWKAIRTLAVAVAVASLSVSGTIAGTQIGTGFFAVITGRLEFPMLRAEIESLRRDAAATPCGANAMLRAQVSELNREIEHEHESNKHWYSDWAVSDKWNTIERIVFPECKQ